MPEMANFCGACGRPVGAAAVASGVVSGLVSNVVAPVSSSALLDALDYTIVGDNLQIARVHLKSGQEVYAEAGKMIYKTANVGWDTRMTGQTLGQKLTRRHSPHGDRGIPVCYIFPRKRGGRSGFRGRVPRQHSGIRSAPGQSLMAQRDAFLFAQPSVQLSVAFVKKLGAGFFGGEGFILEKPHRTGHGFHPCGR